MAAKVVPGLDDNTRLSILDALRPEKQEEGDVTVKEAARDWVIAVTTARTILEEAVERGELIKLVGVRFAGRKGIFYRQKE